MIKFINIKMKQINLKQMELLIAGEECSMEWIDGFIAGSTLMGTIIAPGWGTIIGMGAGFLIAEIKCDL